MPYDQAITATASDGGDPSVTYTVTSGAIPKGLKFATTESELDITGTPTATGSVSFRVAASYPADGSATQVYTLTVNPAARPIVSILSSNAGPAAGGASLTITGQNLGTASTAKVFFGTTQATIVSVNDAGTEIVATLPSHKAGTVNARVQTGGGTSAVSSNDRFTYVAAPVLKKISPASGSTSVDTRVVITGTNLRNATVAFGSTTLTKTMILSDTATKIVVEAPPGSGTVNVSVTTAGGVSNAEQFTYVAAITAAPADLGSPPPSTASTLDDAVDSESDQCNGVNAVLVS